MQLGTRDIISTIGAAIAGYFGYLALRGIAFPGALSQRWVIVILFVAGMAGCIAGGNSGTPDWKNPMIVLLSVLGGIAMVLTLIGLIRPSILMIELLSGTVLVMWLLATLRHAFA